MATKPAVLVASRAERVTLALASGVGLLLALPVLVTATLVLLLFTPAALHLT